MSSSLSALICCCLIVSVAWGEDPPPTGARPVPLRLKEAEVKSLVQQMGGAKEGDREAAVKRLRDAGVAVIPALAEAASKGNRHATNNAIEILRTHVEGADPAGRIAAFEALRRLSVGSRPAVAAAAKKIVQDHKEVRAEADAAKLAARENKVDRSSKNPSPAITNPQPRPPQSDPATTLRRQAIEQSIKEADMAIEKIKKLNLPKQLEDQQISAVMQGVQNLRAQLKELDNVRRK